MARDHMTKPLCVGSVKTSFGKQRQLPILLSRAVTGGIDTVLSELRPFDFQRWYGSTKMRTYARGYHLHAGLMRNRVYEAAGYKCRRPVL